jgi:hypothetical protein
MVRTSGLADTHAVAHELGHYFNLCAIDGARPWAYHSCADTKVANDNQKIRDDSVTRRRIMYPYVGCRKWPPRRTGITWATAISSRGIWSLPAGSART